MIMMFLEAHDADADGGKIFPDRNHHDGHYGATDVVGRLHGRAEGRVLPLSGNSKVNSTGFFLNFWSKKEEKNDNLQRTVGVWQFEWKLGQASGRHACFLKRINFKFFRIMKELITIAHRNKTCSWIWAKLRIFGKIQVSVIQVAYCSLWEEIKPNELSKKMRKKEKMEYFQ